MSALLAALLGAAMAGEVALTHDVLNLPIRVECPVGETTRLLFPERLSRVTASAGAKTAFGITVESYRPFGVLTVRPPGAAQPARLEIAGPSMRLILNLRSVAHAVPDEIRFAWPAAAPRPVEEGKGTSVTTESGPGIASPSPTSVAPEPQGAEAATPPVLSALDERPTDTEIPRPDPATSAATPADVPEADVDDLLSAKPERIGRREGLPGQKPVVLVDALKGEAWLYLRFLVENGSEERLASVTMGDQALDVLVEAPQDKALRIVVRIPRSEITRKTRVTLKLVSGAEYRFGLSSGTLTAFLKGLFR